MGLDDDESLVAVMAHGLLNEITVVEGLVAEARTHLTASTPDNVRAVELLDACQRKTAELAESLRRYVTAGEPAAPPSAVIDLNQENSERA
jgi:hypothetical protein